MISAVGFRLPCGPKVKTVVVFGPRPRSLNWKNTWSLPSGVFQAACWPARAPLINTEERRASDGMSDGSGGTLLGGVCRATKGGAASATPIHRRVCANCLGVMTCLQSRHIIVVISRGSTATVPPLGAILFGQNRSLSKERREAGSPDDAAAACKRGYLARRADRGRGIFRVVHGHQAARSRAEGLPDHREERRSGRHVVGEPLSRMCLRCAIASVFVLVRTQSRLDADVRERAGNP